MKGVIARQLFSILLCTALPLAAAGGAAEQLPDDLMSVIDSFYAAIEDDDIETRVALLDDEIVMMPNDWTMTAGKEAVAAGLRAGAGGVFRIRDREIVHADVSDSLAYTVNSYYYTWHAPEDEAQWHKTKNVHVWARDADSASTSGTATCD
jgi:ketosteroid isomerase-like protein